MKQFRILLCIAILLIINTVNLAQDDGVILRVVTHDSFDMNADLLEQFTSETGITVEFLPLGDAGQMVNQSILSAGNPLGDVLFGVDNTFLSRAINAEIFVPYESPALENVAEDFLLEGEYHVTPIDYGDVCINYDIAYFEDNDLAVPETLEDLTKPEYADLLVAMNPATSSPGLAFLLATISAFGEPTEDPDDYSYLDYWAELVDNGVLITNGWSDAYYGYFTAGSEDGTYPMVVSYASSPPFTYDEELDDVTTSSIIGDNTCFRQVEYAGILAGTEVEDAAKQFIDFMLSEEFQAELPSLMYVFPVVEDVELPEIFAEYAAIPENPAVVAYEAIEENREDWIQAWTETVLR